MGAGSRPLEGRTILLTRPGGTATRLARELEALGARVEQRPTIAFEPPADLPRAQRALERIADYDWVLFTSPTGVRRMFAMARDLPGPAPKLGGRVAAVGPATAAALSEHGIAADVVARGSGEALGRALSGQLEPGQHVLWVRPEVARSAVADAVSATGAAIDAVPFYRNVAASGLTELSADVIDGRFDGVVFTSPSTLERWIENAPPTLTAALARVAIVALGEVTARALERAGLTVGATAAEPSDAAVVAAICGLFAHDSTGKGLCYHPRPTSRSPGRATEEPLGGPDSLKRTPMHAQHCEAGARMVEFAGWHLPVQYVGVIDEHNAVRTRAGLFDVSHMGEVSVRGSGALDYLQKLTCNDVSRLRPGRAQYNALTTPDGTFVDDLLVYALERDEYLLVINAGNTPKDVAWLLEHAAGFDVEVRDSSGEWAQLALQGPKAETILGPLVDAPLGEIRYYRFVQARVCGAPCIVSRTGYTGEDGFEIYAPANAGPDIWREIVERGATHELALVGLAARDTLRLESRMALYGNDIDETTTVLEADLGWIVKLGKGDFIGRDVLVRQSEAGVERKLIGFEMRGRAVARQGYPALVNGNEVGRVTSGSFAPFLRKSIGLVYLPVECAEAGTEFEVEIRGRRQPAVVVPTPFYRRPR